MYALVNAIFDDLKTPQHLRQYLSDYVDTETQDGLALFDVLTFTYDLTNSWPAAHEMFGEDGRPFRQLADIVIQGLQTTPDYESLQELIRRLSLRLEPHKDKHGFVEVVNLSLDEAKHWLKIFNESVNRPQAKELIINA